MNSLSIFFMALMIAALILLLLTRLAVGRVARAHHDQRADFFRRYPVLAGDIVFLGDSLTAGGNWHELFPGLPVKNRGINADTTLKVAERLEDVLAGQPAAVFILIGTNDLPWFEHRSDEAILQTYTGILRRCRQQSPRTRVFVQSIFPRRRSYAARIQALNVRLQALAQAFGYEYIHLFPLLADARGGLRSELTNDHLHLLAEGYVIWSRALQPYVNQFTHTPPE